MTALTLAALVTAAPLTLDWELRGFEPGFNAEPWHSFPGESVRGTISFQDDTGWQAPTGLQITDLPAGFTLPQPRDVLSWANDGPFWSWTGGSFLLDEGSVLQGDVRYDHLGAEQSAFRFYTVLRLAVSPDPISHLSDGMWWSDRQYEIYGDSLFGQVTFTTPEPTQLVSLAALAAFLLAWWVLQPPQGGQA